MEQKENDIYQTTMNAPRVRHMTFGLYHNQTFVGTMQDYYYTLNLLQKFFLQDLDFNLRRLAFALIYIFNGSGIGWMMDLEQAPELLANQLGQFGLTDNETVCGVGSHSALCGW